jgi:hypothetical protein
LSQVDPPIDGEVVELGTLFLPQWVEEIFYAGEWFKIEPGSLNDFVSDHGDTTVYKDPFDGMIVILTQPVEGYKIRQPEPDPPKTNIVPFKDRK